MSVAAQGTTAKMCEQPQHLSVADAETKYGVSMQGDTSQP